MKKLLRLRHAVSLHWLVGSLMLGAFVLLYDHGYGALDPEMLRLKTFDLYQRLKPRVPDPANQDAPVVIIDIDEATLAQYGQWPWPRTLVAKLIDALTSYHVSVIGFDIVFSEPDRTSPNIWASHMPSLPSDMAKKLEAMPSNETIMADSIRKSRVVLGQVGLEERQKTDITSLTRKVQFLEMRRQGATLDPSHYLRQYSGIVRNLPELEDAAAGIGLFSIIPDEDGIYRRVALAERVGSMVYPLLSLEMLRVALGGTDAYQLNGTPNGIDTFVVRTADPNQKYIIPTDKHGKVWVHFARYEPGGSIYISAKDVLDHTVPNGEKRLGGALAVIGTSAAGLKDIRSTPINGTMPGVEVHAQLLETILSHAHLTRPDFAIHIEMGLIVIGGLLLMFLVPRLSAIFDFMLSLAMISGLIGTAWYFYTAKRMLVDASYPSIAILSMFMALSYLNYIREERERRKVKTAFSHYVSPALLEEIAADPTKLKLGGETRDITIMFSDIRGFTTISEKFDAEGLTSFINRFLTPMTNVIMTEKGTIDKYMGDAIMAFWNAPLDVKDHAAYAARAALGMHKAVKELNAKLEADAVAEGKTHTPINIGVGLNSGPCCVGNMGSDQRFDYSALGDDVNLASRLEGQSKTYGVDVVVGEKTHAQLQNRFATIEIDRIQVKGKTQPVTIFALLGDEAQAQEEQHKKVVDINQRLLAAYRAQRWEEAETQANSLAALSSLLDVYSDLYKERIAYYREHPPGEMWDGVYVAKSK